MLKTLFSRFCVKRLTVQDKRLYKLVLRNINACKTYAELMHCAEWLCRLEPSIPRKIVNRLMLVINIKQSLFRKRGNAKCK